jgi:Tol biopolymer transport system component
MADIFPDPSLFGEPVPVPGLSAGDSNVSVTPDGQHMVFLRGAPHQVYSAEWNSALGSWGNMQHIALAGGSFNSTPCLSADGQWLFYIASNEQTPTEVYRSRRQPDGTWSAGQLVPLGITTNAGNSGPFFDGSRLYFSRSTFVPGVGSTGEVYYSEYDLVSDTFGTPKPLDSINTPTSSDYHARVFGDGQTLLWSSDRGAEPRAYDIWMATWDSQLADWANLQKPTWAVGSANLELELAPWYCESTRTLYFTGLGYGQVYQSSVNPIPEPASMVAGLLGLGAVAAYLKRRSKV